MCIQKSEKSCVCSSVYVHKHPYNQLRYKKKKKKYSQHPRSPLYYIVTSHPTLHRNCYQDFLDHTLVLLIFEFKWNQYSMYSFVFSFFFLTHYYRCEIICDLCEAFHHYIVFHLQTCYNRSISSLIVVVVVAQSCLTLFDPMGCSPPGSSVHGISQGKYTRVGCHFLYITLLIGRGYL